MTYVKIPDTFVDTRYALIGVRNGKFKKQNYSTTTTTKTSLTSGTLFVVESDSPICTPCKLLYHNIVKLS